VLHEVRNIGGYLAGSVFCLFLAAQSAGAYSPDSPEVKQIVKRGVEYLTRDKNESGGYGVQSLVGLALVKADVPRDHANIQAAVKACRAQSANYRQNRDRAVYEICVAIIFLCELDPEEYRSEITQMMQVLRKWQKDFGGWGYLEGPRIATGDTSMTQYAVLANWTADRSGVIPADTQSIVKVCNWLMRTQDRSGGWGYQGKDPQSFNLVEQEMVQNSLSAAGIGSIYVCADLLRLTKGSQMSRIRDLGLPAALRLVPKASAGGAKGPLTQEVDTKILARCMAAGNGWTERNYTINPPDWPAYYLYALERYQSFRELAEGREDKNPSWYNDGVTYLKSNQDKDGSWSFDYDTKVDTCFAILFLTRGTKKSIQKAEGYDGRLKGGHGLPTNTAEISIGEDGNIVKSPFRGQAETLLALLEASAADEVGAETREVEIVLSDDPQKRAEELIRLRRLVAADDFAVRMAALKALEKTRDLDNVPTFIFALGDPDHRMVARARNALRSLSRKFDDGLSDQPSEGAKLEAIKRWKEWYLSIRPDAQFLN
jgi:hypothetical protein